MQKKRAKLSLLSVLASAILSTLAVNAHANGWEEITRDEGVVVSRKSVPGRSLPIFRGVVTYRHSIYDVVAVLDDIPLRTKWVHRCTESKLIKKVSDFSRIIYNRTDAPWPVSDRDVIVQSKVVVDPKGQTVKISFDSLKNYRPKRSGLVRIPRLHGFYFMEMLGENKTKVTYQIDSDPGGWLPNWIIKLASKKIPLKTLINLRQQVIKLKKQSGDVDRKQLWLDRLRQETGQVMKSDSADAKPSPTQ